MIGKKDRISKLIVNKLFGTVSNKKISIWVLLLKQILMTLEILPVKICKDLIEEGHTFDFDPKVDKTQIEKDLLSHMIK